MRRWSFALMVAALALSLGRLPAAEISGKVKSVDPDRRTITLTVDGAERTLEVAADAKVTGQFGKKLKKAVTQDVPGGLKGLKEGAGVTLVTTSQDGKDSVTGVKLDDLQPKVKKKKKKAKAG